MNRIRVNTDTDLDECDCALCTINALFGPSILSKIRHWPYPTVNVVGAGKFEWNVQRYRYTEYDRVENWE